MYLCDIGTARTQK